MSKKLDTEEFIRRSKEIFGPDIFDYSKVEYIDYKTKIILIHKATGLEVLQAPNHHLEGKLPKLVWGYTQKITQEEFVKRCIEKHGDTCDYSKTIYNGMDNDIIVIDKDFGEFTIRAFNHAYMGQGHRLRANQKISKSKKFTTEDFVRLAKEVHGDKYDYSLVEYKGCDVPVKIKCLIHNEVFLQTPVNHVNNKHGCPRCGNVYHYSTKEFIELAKSIWGDLYSYDHLEYKNMTSNVVITCPIHGDVEVLARDFIHSGCGCPLCSTNGFSKKETLLKEIIGNFYNGDIESNTYNLLKNPTTNCSLELDIYIPDLKIAFEFNGVHWHSTEFKAENQYKHLNKTKLCEEKGIKLFHVWESDWLERREWVEEKIRRIFDTKNLKIPTKKIVEIDRSWPEFDMDEMEFCGYKLVEEQEPSSFTYKNKYTLFDCGKLIYEKVD